MFVVLVLIGTVFSPVVLSIDSPTAMKESRSYKESWYLHPVENTQYQELATAHGVTPSFSLNENRSGALPSGPMDSAWPMQSHDIQHTGCSQYSTANNPGAEIWRVRGDETGAVESSAIIDNNRIIYFGTMGADESLYALYPNGTIKWKFIVDGLIWSTPAIAEDGTIYVATWGGNYGGYLFAILPNGTMKWIFWHVDSIGCSPTIGSDGTIYFGTMAGYFFAVNPNGTEQWRLYLGGSLISSPAIGTDNIIYIGTTSHYLYAVNPNGTIRWQFGAGQFKGNPSIADDGTIYAPSFDGYLYALNPNGTMKWQRTTGPSIAGAGVALADDGTVYVGTELLRAYYPNGTLKWSANVQGDIYGTVPAVSADGTIYVSAGGSLVTVNPDGTERWRKQLTIAQIHSSPCIGEGDRVYIGSEDYELSPYGYLHAFGLGPLRAEAGGPYSGTALRPTTLTGLAFGGVPPYNYHWDFGDGNTSTEISPTHTYTAAGNYTATFTIIDHQGNTSTDTTMVTMDYPDPTLTITRPTNAVYISDKQLFRFPFPFILGKITVQVAIQDHYNITQVDFCISSGYYTDTSPPFEWTWTERNFHLKDEIYVIAWDAKGRYAEQRINLIKWF